jgi:hypothetical protein
MGLGPRDADGQRVIHSAVQCEGGEVEGGRRDGAHVVVTDALVLSGSDDKRTPHKDVSRVAMGCSYVQWHESSNGIRVLGHKNWRK